MPRTFSDRLAPRLPRRSIRLKGELLAALLGAACVLTYLTTAPIVIRVLFSDCGALHPVCPDSHFLSCKFQTCVLCACGSVDATVAVCIVGARVLDT